MNRIVEELKKVGVFYLASIDKDSPRVRPFGSICEIENHAYICTGNFKDVYKQLSNNPNIELSGMYADGSWIRVRCKVVEDNRLEIQQKVLDDPTGPSSLYKAGDGVFVTYRLENIKALKYSFGKDPEVIKE